jgi:hypothetical protein
MRNKKTGAGGEIYSNSEADKLSSQYGLDLVDEMSKILSEQLAKEMDKDILRSLGIEPDRNKRRIKKIKNIFNV